MFHDSIFMVSTFCIENFNPFGMYLDPLRSLCTTFISDAHLFMDSHLLDSLYFKDLKFDFFI